ncbi:MAG: hypothetical protein IJ544_04325 [Prevotella sp.]|nr:hypothetical protein [Prevotella sp.]
MPVAPVVELTVASPTVDEACSVTVVVAWLFASLADSRALSCTAFLALLASPFSEPNCAEASVLTASIATSAITEIFTFCFIILVVLIELNLFVWLSFPYPGDPDPRQHRPVRRCKGTNNSVNVRYPPLKSLNNPK